MQFAERHIQTAEKIINGYDGSIPLHHHLKQFFAADKKYGSKDRKAISHACYCYYRLGHALKTIPGNERIKAGIFLCTEEPGIWKAAFDESWTERWSANLEGRISFIKTKLPFQENDIFPYAEELSDPVDKDAFITSHLIQPNLHVRIRPGKEKKVAGQLTTAGLHFKNCGDHCVALANSTRIDDVIELNKDAVVQDFSSQRIARFLSTVNYQLPSVKVWDCCAASGGKSILAVDTLKNIELSVSDVRPSIIQNLKKRFGQAGIRNYHSFVADLSGDAYKGSTGKYDLVICDVPCSGSGTWSRNPEQLCFFRREKISYYSSLQQKIIKNVIPAVEANGYLLYITCSVFRQENEEMVEFIKANSSLSLHRMEMLEGYDKKADTMFAALFTASPL